MPYPLTGLLHCGRCGGRMRGHSSYGRRVYICSTRGQHRGDCDQSAVRADDIEAQLLDVIRNLPIPEDWEARVWTRLNPEQDYEEMLEKERAIQARWERAVELCLSGHISQERLEEEKVACNHSLATLRSTEFSAIMTVVKTLQQFDELWQDASPVKKKRLLRVAVSAASTQGPSLGQLVLSEASYSLLCANSNSGSDGIRTRDLRLDRPAC
jgi:hypothetical protein